MSIIWYVLWFVVAVGLLVTVHEFGHFWVARRLGFKVLRFSVGFGRPLLMRVGRDQVAYVIAAVPLGGYVKLLDEREGPVANADLPRSFTRRPPWQRILVLLAGPAFNIVFAVLVLWGMLWASGVTEVTPRVGEVAQGSVAARAGLASGDDIRAINGSAVSSQREVGFDFWKAPAVIAKVAANGAAARAGLAAGDRIVAIDGAAVKDFDDILRLVGDRPGARVTLSYERAGVPHSTPLVIGSEESGGRRIGRLGIVNRLPASMMLHTDLGAGAALGRAAQEAWSMTVLQARMFWRMVEGRVSLKNLSGPVSIAEFAGDSAEAGVASFLSFLVLISLSLGFLNLLPIPILDGGQILFQLVEWLKGSPLSDRAQAFGQQVGIALLIVLMGVALYNDIARQFS